MEVRKTLSIKISTRYFKVGVSRNSRGWVHRASAAKLTKYIEEVVWCHFFCQILDVKNL
jgi:hypothetical protein